MRQCFCSVLSCCVTASGREKLIFGSGSLLVVQSSKSSALSLFHEVISEAADNNEYCSFSWSGC